MKLLFSTDGSECSEGAARLLARFAFSPADEITVLHVVPQIPMKDSREAYYESLRRIRQEIAPSILEATMDCMKGLKAKMATAVEDGDPDEAIVKAAAARGTDLVVLGARGIKGIKSLFIGSVSRSVAINSSVPVLVTKLPQRSSSGPLKVLYATDGSGSAEATGRLLASLPFPEGSAVTVLNVSDSGYLDIPDRLSMEVNDRMKKAVADLAEAEYSHAEKIIESGRALVKRAFGTVTALAKVGNPEEEILNAARTEKADVIALGGYGMRGVKGMIGSVARNVLGHADCSVLIGKGASTEGGVG